MLYQVLLSIITISLAFPNGNELLTKPFEKRNQCRCAFIIADFNSSSGWRSFNFFSKRRRPCGNFQQGLRPY
ncbi:hypothetical protein RhiirC2_797416 [Rhizophagus irregularis]|uniref:Secreted protein n=1 Tax=Rhizophagus irregularis TaxID=588596 RepID=A0A2N1M825_9GLOM|nr:hypothetical protein RhiirC2_797416 [Rhizophagus irregularis]